MILKNVKFSNDFLGTIFEKSNLAMILSTNLAMILSTNFRKIFSRSSGDFGLTIFTISKRKFKNAEAKNPHILFRLCF